MSAHFVTSFDIFTIQAIICLIYCYFGNVISSKSMEISNTAYNIEWYHLHPKSQMIVKLIILRAHSEIHISGFSVIDCSLEVFRKVRDIYRIISVLTDSDGYLSNFFCYK